MLNCEGDLHIFPFDSPMCTFAIESGELQTNIHSIYNYTPRTEKLPLPSVSFLRSQMDFHWAGDNAVEEDGAGSIALSPVLKRHNAYLVHNETVYCNHEDEWRGQ